MADPIPNLKRKISDSDEAELEAKRQRTAEPPKPPASFLTLPSELRQQILLLSHDSLTFEYVFRTTVLLTNGYPEIRYANHIFSEQISDIRAWAETLLQVDDVIEADVVYVYEKWAVSLEDLEKELAEYWDPPYDGGGDEEEYEDEDHQTEDEDDEYGDEEE